MKIKPILKQIWNERKRNGWIFSELLIVFVLLWFLVDYAFVMTHNRLIPKGFDITDTYKITFPKAVDSTNVAQFKVLYDKIRSYKGVQYAFRTNNLDTEPYSGGYSGTIIYANDSTGKEVQAQAKTLQSTDFFKIFRMKSIYSGKEPELDLANRRQVVLTEPTAKLLFGDEKPIGKNIYRGDKFYRVTDVIESQKRFDYSEPSSVAYFFYPKEPIEGSMMVCIRVGDNFDLEAFKQDITSNIIPYTVQSKKIEEAMGVTFETNVRNAVMIFFFLNIALGVIGTFWFRNQARRKEIGLRIASGSYSTGLMKHYILEALLLLTIAAIPAILINIALLNADVLSNPGADSMVESSVYITGNKWMRFIITNALTYIILAVIVGVSAWIPARRAAKINVVEALKDE